MKKYAQMLLTVGLCLTIIACKTTQLTGQHYEGRATTRERADSVAERDSVFTWVYDHRDTVTIVKREVRMRDRIVKQHDTLTVHKTDTIVKTVVPAIRSPAATHSNLKTGLCIVLTAIVTIIISTIIIKFKQLWDKLI